MFATNFDVRLITRFAAIWSQRSRRRRFESSQSAFGASFIDQRFEPIAGELEICNKLSYSRDCFFRSSRQRGGFSDDR